MNHQTTKIFIITGAQGAGKTTLLQQVVELLKKQNACIAGFFAKGYWDAGVRAGFDLVSIADGIATKLCTAHHKASYTKMGRFYFDPETIRKGESCLLDANKAPGTLLVIDEIGLFELEGKLWAGAFSVLLQSGTNHLLITVRDKFLHDVIDKFKLKNVSTFHLSQPAKQIAKQINGHLTG